MNKIKKQQFPSISRFITENKIILKLTKSTNRLLNHSKFKKIILFSSTIFVFLIITFLVVGISFLSFKIYINLNKAVKINIQREKIQGQINFWTSVSDKYPGYKDSYFRIAQLEYSLGDFKKAQEYNKKALFLDPNYDDAKKLELLFK